MEQVEMATPLNSEMVKPNNGLANIQVPAMPAACPTTCPKCGADLTAPEPTPVETGAESPGIFSKVKGIFGFSGGRRRRGTRRDRKTRRSTRRRRTTSRKH